jgi:sugar phosphate isomerase/epimerase
MKLGVAGIVSEWSKIDRDAADRVRAHGFRGVSIFFSQPLAADLKKVQDLRHILTDAGLDAAQANGAYEALVNPDDQLRAEGVRGLNALVRCGRILNAPTVYVRPGGLNPRGHWYAHPGNHTPQTFDRLVDSLRKVSAAAAAEGVILAIEGHVLSVLDTPLSVRNLLDAVGSSALKFNIDPVNFFGSVRDVHDTRPVLNELFDLLGKDTVAAHLKDLALEDDLVLHIAEVVIGQGTLDYVLFLQRLQVECPQVYGLIEHLPEEKIPSARAGLMAAAEKAGIVFEV